MEIAVNKVVMRLPGSDRVLFRIREWTIPAGSKILVHGPSGAGKTTLLHLLAGLVLPDEGTITWDGERTSTLREPQRCLLRREKFAIIFQRLNLLDHLTSHENVLLGLTSSSASSVGAKTNNEKAKKALAAVGLADHEKQLAATLSLGEQQRVAIARALARVNSVILADEPTSSLDDHNAHQTTKLLFEAAGQGTLLVVSHDHRVAGHFTTRIDFQNWAAS